MSWHGTGEEAKTSTQVSSSPLKIDHLISSITFKLYEYDVGDGDDVFVNNENCKEMPRGIDSKYCNRHD